MKLNLIKMIEKRYFNRGIYDIADYIENPIDSMSGESYGKSCVGTKCSTCKSCGGKCSTCTKCELLDDRVE